MQHLQHFSSLLFAPFKGVIFVGLNYIALFFGVKMWKTTENWGNFRWETTASFRCPWQKFLFRIDELLAKYLLTSQLEKGENEQCDGGY